MGNKKAGAGNDIKTWQYLHKLNKEALPYRDEWGKIDKNLAEMVDRLIKHSDNCLLMLWRATPESGAPSCMIADAIGASRNKGLDVSIANPYLIGYLLGQRKLNIIKQEFNLTITVANTKMY